MKTIILATLVVVNVASFAHHVRAETKTTITRTDDKSVSITSRTNPPLSLEQIHLRRISQPAPPNNCPRIAFETISRLEPNEQRCTNLLNGN